MRKAAGDGHTMRCGLLHLVKDVYRGPVAFSGRG